MSVFDIYNQLKTQNITDKATKAEILRNIDICNKKLADMEDNADLLDKSMQCLLSLSEYSRSSVKNHFEKFVTYILQYVFGENYSFEIDWITGAKTTTVNLLVKAPPTYAKPPYDKESFIAIDPVNGKGGGVCDVVAFGLRLAFLTLLKNKAPIFLDESFSQISKSYIPDVSALLHDVNDKFGYQIIFITHYRDSSFTEDADYLLTL